MPSSAAFDEEAQMYPDTHLTIPKTAHGLTFLFVGKDNGEHLRTEEEYLRKQV